MFKISISTLESFSLEARAVGEVRVGDMLFPWYARLSLAFIMVQMLHSSCNHLPETRTPRLLLPVSIFARMYTIFANLLNSAETNQRECSTIFESKGESSHKFEFSVFQDHPEAMIPRLIIFLVFVSEALLSDVGTNEVASNPIFQCPNKCTCLSSNQVRLKYRSFNNFERTFRMQISFSLKN